MCVCVYVGVCVHVCVFGCVRAGVNKSMIIITSFVSHNAEILSCYLPEFKVAKFR